MIDPYRKLLNNTTDKLVEFKKLNFKPNDYFLYKLTRHETPGIICLDPIEEGLQVWHVSRAGSPHASYYNETKNMIKKYLEISPWVYKNPTPGRARAYLEHCMDNLQEITILLDKINEFYTRDKYNIEIK